MSEINTWPGWTCVRQLGAGSFGKVYEIERIDNGVLRKSALKVMSFPMSPNDVQTGYAEGWYSDEMGATTFYNSQIDMFSQEYKLMSAIGRTPNIVSFEDYMVVPHNGWIGADILIRMELLSTFNQHRNSHPLTEKDIVKLGLDISNALDTCQKLDPPILHRDIKLDNIMVDSDGNYKLGDFGVARFMEGTKSAHTVAGTENYMAPEVLKGKGYTVTADIYSLGIVLYRLLNNNRNPFLPVDTTLTYAMQEEAKVKRLDGETPPPPMYGNERLKKIVLKCIEFNPEDRYQNAEELKGSFEKLLSGKKDNALNAKKKSAKKKTGKKITIALIAAILVIGAVAAIKNLGASDRTQSGGNVATDSSGNVAVTEQQGDEYITADNEVIDVGKTTNVAFHFGKYIFRSDDKLNWSSSDSNIATVDNEGTVTGISAGEVTISGEYDGKSAGIAIRVDDPRQEQKTDTTKTDAFSDIHYDEVEILLNCNTIVAGDTVRLGIRTESLYVEGNAKEAEWSVDDASVATVSADGKVTAKAPGKCKITLKYYGAVGEKEVTVVPENIKNDMTLSTEYQNIAMVSTGTETINISLNGGKTGNISFKAYSTDDMKFDMKWGEYNSGNNSIELRVVDNYSKGQGYIVILVVDDNNEVCAYTKVRVKVN